MSVLDISNLILDNCVLEFAPTFKDIPDYEGFRISSNGEVQSSLCPVPGKREWKPGSVWRTLKIQKSLQSGVLMVSLRSSGQKRSFPVKKLLADAFIRVVGPDEIVVCQNGIETDLSLVNLEVSVGRFVRRTSLYKKKP